jgi:ATPase subunit of ABC transporter with duplicated ATPase domains
MHLLGAEALSIAYQGRSVLADVGLGIESGDRIGVVGRNGDGKTTLLELLAGLRSPDSGRVTRRGGLRIALLPQTGLPVLQPGFARASVGAAGGAGAAGSQGAAGGAGSPGAAGSQGAAGGAGAADSPGAAGSQGARDAAAAGGSAAQQPGQGDGTEGVKVRDVIVGEMAEHEWAGDGRVRAVLAGLVGDIDLDSRFDALSGGQRRRVALAAVLVGEHDLLLLDEPTNHLDMTAIAWLADHLRTRWPAGRGALVAVTHDRWFLDAVCTQTWEVHSGRVEPFDGGYAAYVLARVERQRQAAASEARRRGILRKELAWLRRGPPARTSKPRFRMEAAAALIAAEPPPRDSVELTRLATARLGKDVIDLLDASAAYDVGPCVLRDVNWLIGPGERSGILGANGAGKSTLLALVAGRLAPVGGRVKIGATVQVATLTQEASMFDALADVTADELIAERKAAYSAGQSLGWTGGGRDAAAARSGEQFTPGVILERLGFGVEHMRTPIGRLSGGQRRRLQLALVLMEEPNVLILDEPTNDLDTDMLAAMEDLLDSWPGTLLVATHDRYFMERVTDQQYAVLDGQVRMVAGGVEEYLQLAQPGGAGAVAGTGGTGGGPGGGTGGGPGEPGGAGGKASALVRTLRKQASAIDRQLSRLRSQLEAANQELAEHDPTDYIGIGQKAGQAEAIKQQIDAAEERWLELAEQIELHAASGGR